MSTSSVARADALNHLHLNQRHLLAIVVCTMGSFCDVLELVLGSVLSTVYSVKTSPVTSSALAWLLAAPAIGTVVGTPILGWTADRVGRRTMLIVDLGLLAVSSVCAALSPDIRTLTGFRLLSGVAIGSYISVMATYLAELLPMRDRGRIILLATAVGSLAWPVSILGARLLSAIATIDQGAWRYICAGGGIGAALTALLATQIEESPRWLSARGRLDGAQGALQALLSAKPLFQSRSVKVRLNHYIDAPMQQAVVTQPIGPARLESLRYSLVGALHFLCPWSTAGFPLLLGAILISRGFPVNDTLLLTGISAIGGPVGLFTGSVIVDRVERRSALLALATTMVGTAILFATLSAPAALVAIAVVFTFCLVNYAQILNMYVAELFPSRQRAFATSVGWTVNRIAAAIVPFVLLPVLHSRGTLVTCGTMACTMSVSAALLFIAPKGQTARPVL